jgi:predicted GH43/DUF377 family glycosyl hydrolase
MIEFKRSEENPVLRPNPDNDWEAEATFNGCPILVNGKVVVLYRAVSLHWGYREKSFNYWVCVKLWRVTLY